MKNPILILCFIALTSAIYGQNLRVETNGDRQIHTYSFQKGGDSIRFDIRDKNDTMEITELYRNGKINKIIWKKDSSYQFDGLGRLRLKIYDLNNKKYEEENDISYYANGHMFEFKSFKNYIRLHKIFAENGQLLYADESRHIPSVYTYREMDRQGVPITSSRTDTIRNGTDFMVKRCDTIFFSNGKPYKVVINQSNDTFYIEQTFKETDGALVSRVKIKNSALIIFKDNVACYYGLKNAQGDTVIAPRFDQIKDEFYFFVAFTGEQLTLLDKNGLILNNSKHWTRMGKMYSIGEEYSYEEANPNIDFPSRSSVIDTAVVYFQFEEGAKYGVLTTDQIIVIPPQYLALDNTYINRGQWFGFNEKQKDSIVSKGYLTAKGDRLFDKKFKDVTYSNYQDYFYLDLTLFIPKSIFFCSRGMVENLTDNRDFSNLPEKNTVGLGKSDGTVLIEPKFVKIYHLYKTPLFIATSVKTDNATSSKIINDGIFNAATKKWLLDTTGFVIQNNFNQQLHYFIIKELKTGKYGIMDTTGNYILPLIYDSVRLADLKQGLYYLKKDNKYQIFDIKEGKVVLHKPKYNNLYLLSFRLERFVRVEHRYYFLAQPKRKWGIIDTNDSIIKSFNYDYASSQNEGNEKFVLVKNNKVTYYGGNSLPNEIPADFDYESVKDYPLAGKPHTVFFVNEDNKVILPPQYQLLKKDANGNYALFEDPKKHKKLLFTIGGEVIDYPFDYQIELANYASKVIVVKDTGEVSYGVVSTDGKLLVPCNNYAVALADEDKSVFFVKRDTPLIKRDFFNNLDITKQVNSDTLNEEDHNWLMYNGEGKLLSDKPFRFPIYFFLDIGIGMQDDIFNLYKTDGSILMPFNKNGAFSKIYTEGGKISNNKAHLSLTGFQNIRRDRETDYYFFFYTQGLTPTLLVTTKNGEIVIESGRYDGISQFYGRYALVSTKGKIGLIDTSGREVIPPQNLRTYTAHFMDSLNLINKIRQEALKEGKVTYINEIEQPIDFKHSSNPLVHPDSLTLSTFQRASLWNLLLEKCLLRTIYTASDMKIERVNNRVSTSFLDFDWAYSDKGRKLQQVVVNDKTMSFVLDNETSIRSNKPNFYNFYYHNNYWEELKINDLLQIQGEKRWLMNDLITKKVKALKDQQIDCSNASAFITTVENRFMLTKNGIDFCFDSTHGGDFVVISFTWAELTPFLKLRIY